jgi:tRNA (guanine26-N2/guanine27-N2)-dimethyltransferase
MEAAIRNLGYRVSGYHKEPQAIKTDAPDGVVWDIIREWHRQNHGPTPTDQAAHGGQSKKKNKKKNRALHVHGGQEVAADAMLVETATTATETESTIRTTSPSLLILSRPVATLHIDFNEKRVEPSSPSRPPSSSLPRAPRFPMNPQPNWGPKPRAVGSAGRKRKANSDPTHPASEDRSKGTEC